jgi:hypothetical protein
MFAAPGNNAFDSYFLIVDYPCLNGNSFCPTGSFYPAVYSSIDMEKGIYVYFDKKQVENRFNRFHLKPF